MKESELARVREEEEERERERRSDGSCARVGTEW